MSTDRELLQAAAKAAGYEIKPYTWSKGTPFEYEGFKYDDELMCDGDYEWDPLDSDSQAFRLAVRLRLKIEVFRHVDEVTVYAISKEPIYKRALDWNIACSDTAKANEGDLLAATRRAIVRAAAALGEQHDQ